MTIAAFDLNISPPKLLDLNEYPEESYGEEEATGDDGRVLRDLDLNVAPQPESEEAQSIQGASFATGKLCFRLVVLKLIYAFVRYIGNPSRCLAAVNVRKQGLD
uniref:Uncharacterized protein n=1 Tax=Arundo donax TaxID=35708 RepID=A0A0A9FPP8_ARUDO